MNNNEIFPPATARVLFLSCKDFPDDFTEIKPFFFCRGDVLADSEVGFAVKSINPQAVVEELLFKRVIFRINGRSYPFYIDRKNFDFVVPIINGMIEEGIRKGKEEYEHKLRQKEQELETRTKKLSAIEREFWEKEERFKTTIEFANAIMLTKTYRFVKMLKDFGYGLENFWDGIKNFNKYRIRIERKNEEE